MLKKLTLTLSLCLLAACGGETAATANHAAVSGSTPADGTVQLLNVSYDVMRDFYKDYNPLFIKHYQQTYPGSNITVQQSHGGSSKQALAVANGLQADVVTMNQSSDIELLQNKGLVSADWQQAFPDRAVPFGSITVFLVRKGNPKNIRDWADLNSNGIQSVLANPKTSGNGRYTFIAAYGYALKKHNGDHNAAKEFVRKLFANTAVLEAGGRGATTTFVQRKIGDVLVTFENEAQLAARQFAQGEFEIVYPSYSVRAESPVAVVQSVTDKKGTSQAAKAYLDYLWSDEGQTLAAERYLRPSQTTVAAKFADRFPKVETFRANDLLGSWDEIMKTYFADGGVFDQISKR